LLQARLAVNMTAAKANGSARYGIKFLQTNSTCLGGVLRHCLSVQNEIEVSFVSHEMSFSRAIFLEFQVGFQRAVMCTGSYYLGISRLIT